MEETIIQCAQTGDQQAFQQLIEMYNGIAWRTAQVMLADRSMVEDVMQEAWLDVWRGLARFQGGRPFRPWLLTIVANRCRMVLRKRSKAIQLLTTSGVEESLYVEDVLEDVLQREEDVELREALNVVSAEQRQILELRFFAELELGEIALITGIPLGTVKSRLHRALNSVRQHLKKKEEAYKETNL